jgi:undecaprenyl-diphosphatase
LGLLSKQTMFAFLGLGGLFVVISRDDRHELVRPTLWLTAAGALLFLTPVVWWNTQHAWITLEHTSEHFRSGSVTFLERLAMLGEYLLGQGGVLSPLTAILLAAATFGGLTVCWKVGRREKYLLTMSGVPLIGVVLLALFQRIEPNWPAAFYMAAIVLLAGWATGATSVTPIVDRLRRLFVPALGVGVLCCVAVYALPFLLPWTAWHGSQVDPTSRLRGWRELAAQVDQKLAALPHPDRTLVVSTAGRAVASELAFYMAERPRVYVHDTRKGIRSQYDLWGGPRNGTGLDALIISLPDTRPPDALCQAFDRLEPLDKLVVPLGGDRRLAFRLWHGTRLRAWPD